MGVSCIAYYMTALEKSISAACDGTAASTPPGRKPIGDLVSVSPNTARPSWSRTRIAVVLRGHAASAVELELTVLDSLCPIEQRQESDVKRS
jgi:hypothetical protein